MQIKAASPPLRDWSTFFALLLTEQLEKSQQEPLRRLANTLQTWWHELINYFTNRWTNGFTEATNGNAKALQKRARGYKNFVNYRLKTLNACFF